MKKIIALCAVLASCSTLYAQSFPCTDLKTNLTRGAESQNVLMLQQFLYARGLLKATPNGYFGPATLAAAKMYQASVGLPSTGAVLGMTRASIKKETCESSQVTVPVIASSTSQTTTTPPMASPVVYPRPAIAYLDKGTLFKGAEASWSVIINGTSFASTSNAVYFKNRANGRRYMIGSFESFDGKTITLPQTLMKDTFVCGANCGEPLSIGGYDVTVETKGGESNAVYASVQGFGMSAVSGSLSTPVRQNATSTLIARVSFGASVPVFVVSFSVDMKNEGVVGGVSNVQFKDEVTGEKIVNYGTALTIGENQSKIIGIYGDINSYSPGTLLGSAKVTVQDFVGQKAMTFYSPEFLTTVSGF